MTGPYLSYSVTCTVNIRSPVVLESLNEEFRRRNLSRKGNRSSKGYKSDPSEPSLHWQKCREGNRITEEQTESWIEDNYSVRLHDRIVILSRENPPCVKLLIVSVVCISSFFRFFISIYM